MSNEPKVPSPEYIPPDTVKKSPDESGYETR